MSNHLVSSYNAEESFSLLNLIKSVVRVELAAEHVAGVLHFAASTFTPDI
jgi:hypothetical protein